MKRTISLICLVSLLVSLSGCIGAPSAPATQPSQTQPSSPKPTETTQATIPSQPTQPTQPTGPVETAFTVGDIYITADHDLSGEYSEASVRVEMEGYSLPEQAVTIKHRGNLSQQYASKKSYNIKFSEKVSLLGMEEGKKWSLLADPFDKSLLRPILAMEYAQALGIPFTSQVRLCRVWLNGKYRGVYTATEPVDVKTNRVEIDLDAGDFLFERNYNSIREEEGITYFTTAYGLRFELNEPEVPTDDQLEAVKTTLNAMEKAIRTLDHTQYARYIDVDSFVNFYILHEVCKDVDFGHFSTRYYVKDGVLFAGPPWDFDLSMGNVSATYGEKVYKRYHNQGEYGNGSGDSTQNLWNTDKDFYRWLCEDPWFMEQVKLRWQEVRLMTENLAKENALGISRIDFYLEKAGDILESNYTEAGWSVSSQGVNLAYDTPAKTYLGNVDILRQWLQKRIAWLDGELGT